MARDVESGGVKSEDPLNVRVAIRLGDDTLVVTLDDTATVVDVARDKEL